MFRRKPNLIRYQPESVESALKYMRTHIAAQADQLSTLTTLVTGLDQRLRDGLADAVAERQWANEHRERIEQMIGGRPNEGA